MRWNASPLLVAGLALGLSGCSLFEKKEPDLSSDPAYGAGLDDYDYGAGVTDSTYASGSMASEPVSTYPSTPSYGSDSSGMQDAGLSGSSAGSGARYHTVAKGDTLYSLARRYYSKQRRWKDIYEANRNQISDPNKIRVGQRLLIP